MSIQRLRVWVLSALVSTQLVSCVSADRSGVVRICESHSQTLRLVGDPISLAEYQSAMLARDTTYFASSGERTALWQVFAAKVKPGDELFRYSEEQRHPGFGYAQGGIALIRGKCIFAHFEAWSMTFG